MSASMDGRRTTWWGAFLLTLGAVVGTYAVAAASGAVRAARAGSPFTDGLAAVLGDPLGLGLAQAGGFALTLLLALRVLRRPGGVLEELGVVPLPLRDLGLAGVAGAALQLPLAEIQNLLHGLWPVPLEEQLRLRELLTPEGPLEGAALVFAVVLVAPVSEELLFRGLMLRDLAERHRLPLALFLSAALFGLSHGAPQAVAYATTGGLLLGWVAWRTGSTLASVVMHAGINAVPLLVPERLVRIPGFNTISEEAQHVPPGALLGALAVASLALFFLARTTDLETP